MRMTTVAVCRGAARPAALLLAALSSIVAARVADGKPSSGQAPSTIVEQAAALRREVKVNAAAGERLRQVPIDVTPSRGPNEDSWYLVDALVRINMKRGGSAHPLNAVEVVLNGHPVVLISLARQVHRGLQLTWWSASTFLNGFMDGATVGASTRLRVRDYAKVGSVHRGRNALGLVVNQADSRLIDSAELLPGTDIERTAFGPPDVSLRIGGVASSIRVGHAVYVNYRVVNVGFPVQSVGLATTVRAVNGPADGVVVCGQPTQLYIWPVNVHGRACLRGLARGRYRVSVGLVGNTGTIDVKHMATTFLVDVR